MIHKPALHLTYSGPLAGLLAAQHGSDYRSKVCLIYPVAHVIARGETLPHEEQFHPRIPLKLQQHNAVVPLPLIQNVVDNKLAL